MDERVLWGLCCCTQNLRLMHEKKVIPKSLHESRSVRFVELCCRTSGFCYRVDIVCDRTVSWEFEALHAHVFQKYHIISHSIVIHPKESWHTSMNHAKSHSTAHVTSRELSTENKIMPQISYQKCRLSCAHTQHKKTSSQNHAPRIIVETEQYSTRVPNLITSTESTLWSTLSIRTLCKNTHLHEIQYNVGAWSSVEFQSPGWGSPTKVDNDKFKASMYFAFRSKVEND